MSLLRLPFILAALLGQLKTFINPNPRSFVTNSYSRWDIIMGGWTGPFVLNSLHTIAASAEATVILATHFPSLPFAQPLLSVLVARGTPVATVLRITPLFLFATLLAAGGGLLRVRCYRELGAMYTFKSSIQADHRLVTRGPYAAVRHPGYAALLMMYTGTLLWHLGTASWVRGCGVLGTTAGRGAVLWDVGYMSVIAFGLLRRMGAEDTAMRKRFGREWDAWAERVPWRLVPGVY